MAELSSDGLFTSYKLNEFELQAAKELSPETVMYIKNLLSDVARDKVAMALDVVNHTTNIQNEAYFRGQMDAYLHLLASHEYVMQIHKQAIHVELNLENT